MHRENGAGCCAIRHAPSARSVVIHIIVLRDQAQESMYEKPHFRITYIDVT